MTVYKTKAGSTRRIIIRDSPSSFDDLQKRFSKYKGLLITIDNKGLHQGSCFCCPITGKPERK